MVYDWTDLCVDDSGNISFKIFNQTTEAFELMKTDAEGNELARKSEIEILPEENFMSYMTVDKKGNLIAASSEEVVVLDEHLEPIGYLFTKGWRVSGLAMGRDGELFCARITDRGSYVIDVLDVDKMQWKETYQIKNVKRDTNMFEVTNDCGDYDFYHQDDEGVYGYLIKDKKSVKLIDYTASGVIGTESIVQKARRGQCERETLK